MLEFAAGVAVGVVVWQILRPVLTGFGNAARSLDDRHTRWLMRRKKKRAGEAGKHWHT